YPAYPPYYPYYYTPGAALFTFTLGVAIGSALWGNCNWGGGNVNVNVNVNKYNNFNKTNISNGNWQHSPEHRKGAQYRDQASQSKYGKGQREGAASREQFRGRAEDGRRDIERGGDQIKRDVANADRGGGTIGDRGGAGDRGGVGDRGGAGDRGGVGDRGGAGDRGGVGDRGGAGDRGGSSFDRGGGGGGRGRVVRARARR